MTLLLAIVLAVVAFVVGVICGPVAMVARNNDCPWRDAFRTWAAHAEGCADCAQPRGYVSMCDVGIDLWNEYIERYESVHPLTDVSGDDA